jgi:hypothetical protein
MVNNFTNINKKNNHLKVLLNTLNTKKGDQSMTYDKFNSFGGPHFIIPCMLYWNNRKIIKNFMMKKAKAMKFFLS